MLRIIKKFWERSVIRFGAVGSFNFVVDFALLNLLISVFHAHPIIANSISVAVAITVSYFLNHRIVFRHTSKYSLKRYARFFAVSGISAIGIQDFIIQVVAPHVVHVDAGDTIVLLGHTVSTHTVEVNVAKVVAVLAGMIWNFILYRYVVFRKPGTPPDEEIVSL